MATVATGMPREAAALAFRGGIGLLAAWDLLARAGSGASRWIGGAARGAECEGNNASAAELLARHYSSGGVHPTSRAGAGRRPSPLARGLLRWSGGASEKSWCML